MLAHSQAVAPLLIVLCGTRAKFEAIRGNYERVAQQMDLIELGLLERREVKHFFSRAFNVAGRGVSALGMDVLVDFSGCHPKVMHLIGETALWSVPRGFPIDEISAYKCANSAADDWGMKCVNPRLLSLFEEAKHKRVLVWLCKPNVSSSFTRAKLLTAVGQSEARHVDYLLGVLQDYGVVEHGEERGEWQFLNPLSSLYLHRVGLELVRKRT